MGHDTSDQDEIENLLSKVLQWIAEPVDPLRRLHRADIAYTALAQLVQDVGADGLRGKAARDLIQKHGVGHAAELAGYSERTMRRIAWK